MAGKTFMKDQEIYPYYECFCGWLQFIKPTVFMQFQTGSMSADQIKPYIREWASGIKST